MRMPHYVAAKGHEICDRCFTKLIIKIPDYFFQATLKFEKTEAGYRSGAWSWWRSVDKGILYPITLGEMDEVIKQTNNNGEVFGTWEIKKKGASFSLSLFIDSEEEISTGGIFGTT